MAPRTSSSSLGGRSHANGSSSATAVGSSRRQSTDHPKATTRRPSDYANNGNVAGYSYRRESLGLPSMRQGSEDRRRKSSSEHETEADRRRLSEAGFRRQSNADAVLNDDTDSLRVGDVVWVDGNKQGRVAYIGNVQFAKGEVAGVHLLKPYGKNNGTVGGVLYFQCEPRHGIFARLHRLTRQPLMDEADDMRY